MNIIRHQSPPNTVATVRCKRYSLRFNALSKAHYNQSHNDYPILRPRDCFIRNDEESLAGGEALASLGKLVLIDSKKMSVSLQNSYSNTDISLSPLL
jgi:hypothetical protein